MGQLSKRQQSILRMQQFNNFACPHCGEKMDVRDDGSIVCTYNHSFDVAKQGYVFMLTKPMNSMYSSELFESRRIIIESGMYDEVQQTIAKMLVGMNAQTVVDMGCGEGSHLARIVRNLPNVMAVGMDIVKEAIVSASKYYPDCIWCVGDLANTPFVDNSFDCIINFLSPANYEEFRRIVKPGGKMIKVVPQEGYLQEIRKAAFEDKEYSNEKIVERFSEHFSQISVERVTYKVNMTEEFVPHLVKMTPMGWHIDNVNELNIDQITVDLDVLIGEF